MRQKLFIVISVVGLLVLIFVFRPEPTPKVAGLEKPVNNDRGLASIKPFNVKQRSIPKPTINKKAINRTIPARNSYVAEVNIQGHDIPGNLPLPPHLNEEDGQGVQQAIMEAKQNDLESMQELIISMQENGLPESHIDNQIDLLNHLENQIESEQMIVPVANEDVLPFEERIEDMELSFLQAGMTEQEIEAIVDQEFEAEYDAEYDALQEMDHNPEHPPLNN